MKKLLAITITGLFLFGCGPDTPAEIVAHNRTVDEENISELMMVRYYHDERTDLCFAARYVGFREGLLTSVPCNAAVLESATNFKSDK